MVTQTEAPLSILRRKQVEARTGLSRSTIYERVAAGRFPTPVNLGGQQVGWVEAEITAWITERIQQSRAAQSPKSTANDDVAVAA